jgi:hypothetical protein
MADALESALRAAADMFELRLGDTETRAELVLACQAGQQPCVLRPIAGIPGAAVLIMCGKPETLPSG